MAQIYRLRKTARYRERHATYRHTRPTTVAIGERRKPDPQGRPGFLRVDTVHQGDQDGGKGLYHINGSEFINSTVSRLLNKLLVEQTKSRPRHSRVSRQRRSPLSQFSVGPREGAQTPPFPWTPSLLNEKMLLWD